MPGAVSLPSAEQVGNAGRHGLSLLSCAPADSFYAKNRLIDGENDGFVVKIRT
ncbi:hypothetical protein [Streptomyces sp. NPDC005805]|uniref:hypothetical protein n=1 Tax=Streptomyces sp. NPDC005805 TaxID=3157068 RepID=UPI0033CD22C8